MNAKTDWLKQRNLSVFMTPRDIDVPGMDVERLAQDLSELNVTMISFLAGGYIANYPTELPLQRKVPGLGKRDFPREVIDAVRRFGIKACTAVDLGVLPAHAAAAHPDWCALDAQGRPYEIVPGELYNACLMGGYFTDYGFRIVREIITRYRPDAFQLNNFGFIGKGICYCPSCRDDFRRWSGGESIPLRKDWNDPLFRRFLRWREIKTNEGAARMRRMVKEVDPDLPFMGNSACFGDAGWVLGSSIDKEGVAEFEDIVKVEAQTRIRTNVDKLPVEWQWIHWTAEEAGYLTSVIDDKPVYVVASYFVAWPWRRIAVPPAEQKAYFAQIVANGAWPAVNLSGGAPADHDDKRGFRAIRELYGFVREHRELFDRERSAARVAIVYSQPTLLFYGDERAARYVEAIRGVEQSLQEAHIPFDIISGRTLADPRKLARYKTLILPSMACMSAEEGEAVRRFVRDGGGLVATFETSLYDADGQARDNFLLHDLFAADYAGAKRPLNDGDPLKRQTYMKITERHPIAEGLEDVSLIPLAGEYCAIRSGAAEAAVSAPLKRLPAFLLNPEGFAYPRDPLAVDPLAVVSEHGGCGRVVYFAGQPDQNFWNVGYPDLGTLLAGAVKWTAVRQELELDGPPTLYITFRQQDNRKLVHLINMTGGRRFFHTLVPIHDIAVRLQAEPGRPLKRVYLASGSELPVVSGNQWHTVRIPRLTDYDILVFELEETHRD